MTEWRRREQSCIMGTVNPLKHLKLYCDISLLHALRSLKENEGNTSTSTLRGYCAGKPIDLTVEIVSGRHSFFNVVISGIGLGTYYTKAHKHEMHLDIRNVRIEDPANSGQSHQTAACPEDCAVKQESKDQVLCSATDDAVPISDEVNDCSTASLDEMQDCRPGLVQYDCQPLHVTHTSENMGSFPSSSSPSQDMREQCQLEMYEAWLVQQFSAQVKDFEQKITEIQELKEKLPLEELEGVDELEEDLLHLQTELNQAEQQKQHHMDLLKKYRENHYQESQNQISDVFPPEHTQTDVIPKYSADALKGPLASEVLPVSTQIGSVTSPTLSQTLVPGHVPQTMKPQQTLPRMIAQEPGTSQTAVTSQTPPQTLLPGQRPQAMVPVQTFPQTLEPGQRMIPGQTIPQTLVPGQTTQTVIPNQLLPQTLVPLQTTQTMMPGQTLPQTLVPGPTIQGMIPSQMLPQTLIPGQTTRSMMPDQSFHSQTIVPNETEQEQTALQSTVPGQTPRQSLVPGIMPQTRVPGNTPQTNVPLSTMQGNLLQGVEPEPPPSNSGIQNQLWPPVITSDLPQNQRHHDERPATDGESRPGAYDVFNLSKFKSTPGPYHSPVAQFTLSALTEGIARSQQIQVNQEQQNMETDIFLNSSPDHGIQTQMTSDSRTAHGKAQSKRKRSAATITSSSMEKTKRSTSQNYKHNRSWGYYAWRMWAGVRNKRFQSSNNPEPFKLVPYNFQKIEAKELNYLLSLFVLEVRRGNGENYPPRSLYCLCGALSRHIRDNEGRYDLNFLDASDQRFKSFRDTLDDRMSELARSGLGTPARKTAEFISSENENLLWERVFSKQTAKSLSYAVFFYISKVFGLRDSEEHYNLQREELVYGRDEIGRFIKYDPGTVKEHQGGLKPQKVSYNSEMGKVYENEVNVYKVLCRYMDLIPSKGPFYRKPLDTSLEPSGRMFSEQRVEKSALSSYFHCMAKEAGLSDNFLYPTSHSGKLGENQSNSSVDSGTQGGEITSDDPSEATDIQKYISAERMDEILERVARGTQSPDKDVTVKTAGDPDTMAVVDKPLQYDSTELRRLLDTPVNIVAPSPVHLNQSGNNNKPFPLMEEESNRIRVQDTPDASNEEGLLKDKEKEIVNCFNSTQLGNHNINIDTHNTSLLHSLRFTGKSSLCHPCGTLFRSNAEFLHHMYVWHSIKTRHLATISDSSKQTFMAKPQIKTLNPAFFTCTLCTPTSEFQYAVSFKMHLRLVHGIESPDSYFAEQIHNTGLHKPQSFACSFCKFSTDVEAQLQQHLFSKHQGSKHNKSMEDSADSFSNDQETNDSHLLEKSSRTDGKEKEIVNCFNSTQLGNHNINIDTHNASLLHSFRFTGKSSLCHPCGQLFQSDAEFLQHMHLQHNIKTRHTFMANPLIKTLNPAFFECILCTPTSEFQYDVSFKMHLRLVHGIETPDSYITEQLDNERGLYKPQSFICLFCKFTTEVEGELRNHLLKEHQESKVDKPSEDETHNSTGTTSDSSNQTFMAKQINTLNPAFFKCTLCTPTSEFQHAVPFKMHLRLVHGIESPDSYIAEQLHIEGGLHKPQSFVCFFCKFSTDVEAKLQQHLFSKHQESKVDKPSEDEAPVSDSADSFKSCQETNDSHVLEKSSEIDHIGSAKVVEKLNDNRHNSNTREVISHIQKIHNVTDMDTDDADEVNVDSDDSEYSDGESHSKQVKGDQINQACHPVGADQENSDSNKSAKFKCTNENCSFETDYYRVYCNHMQRHQSIPENEDLIYGRKNKGKRVELVELGD